MSRRHANDMRAAYLRFGAMIATAMTAMFVLTYVNTYALDHVRWSETRFYMTFVMAIRHHSIAILTSERSSIDDVRVRELANEIITSQRREIAEMDWLIDDIGENGVARTADAARGRLVPDFGPETPQRRFKRDS
jgi:uncharacterized protein (DUF305 family)